MSLACRLHHDLLLPLLPIVAGIGRVGIPFDRIQRQRLLDGDSNSPGVRRRIGDIDVRLAMDFGLTAPESARRTGYQLKAMGVPLTEMTKGKTQFKTDLEILAKLNHYHNVLPDEPRFPYLPMLIERRRLEKTRTNLEGLRLCEDGRLRTRLNALGTKTDRYSSAGFYKKQKPGYCPVCKMWGFHGTNLQNTPKPNEKLGIDVRSCIRPEKGWLLGEADYRGLEMFVQAYRMRCTKLIDRLVSGMDLHTAHGEILFRGLEITKRRRTLAKNFFYAMRGGGKERAIQIALVKWEEFLEQSTIREYINAIFGEYPEMPQWIAETDTMLARQRDAGERQIIRNGFGRPRVLMGGDPLKEALATEISGTGAWIMNGALLILAYENPWVLPFICMQIHDSYIIHAPKDRFGDVMGTVLEAMQRPVIHWDQCVSYLVEAKGGDMPWSQLPTWKG